MIETAKAQIDALLADDPPIAVLTGAGCSAESGVPTFRGAEGLWKQYRPEELASPEAFARDPDLVWEWYAWRRERLFPCQPNAAHRIIAAMERRFGDFSLITQNVDGLHQLAGSTDVVELHGNIWRVFDPIGSYDEVVRVATLDEVPPRCPQTGNLLRPGVVWFGEALPPDAIQAADAAMSRFKVLFVVGTSAVVYPAAYFPVIAKRHGAFVVEINPDATSLSEMVDIALPMKAGEALPQLFPDLVTP